MFLYTLNKQEGEAFIELANIAMMVNGEIKECEKAVFDDYLLELGLSNYQLKNLTLEQATSAFSHSNKAAKRSVIIELCGILYSDKDFDRDEEAWLKSLASNFNLEKLETERLISWSKDFSDFIEVGLMYLNCK